MHEIIIEVPAPTVEVLDGQTPDEPDVPTPEEEDPEFSQELLEIGFTTAFHAAEPFFAEPGEQVTFGTVLVKSRYGGMVDMSYMSIELGADGNQDGFYGYGNNAEVSITDHVEECVLRSWPSMVEYTIPNTLSSEGNLFGTMLYPIGGEDAVALDIVCQLTDSVPVQQIGLTAEIPNPTFMATVHDEFGLEVPIVVTDINGNPPQVAVLIEGEDWDVGAVQHIYNNGLLPPQGLFDWYMEEDYYADSEEDPFPMLTADTLSWNDEGTFTADAVEWTLFATYLDTPVSLDPNDFIDECMVNEISAETEGPGPWSSTQVGSINVTGSSISLPLDWLTPISYEGAESYTVNLSCAMLENTTGETVMISAVFTGVVNPSLEETGQELEVDMAEHDSLVFYHLPE